MQHFPEIQLTFQEARVLGCLLEKEILIPGSYPLSHLLSSSTADSPFLTGAPPAASDTPAENDWRAAIEARPASLESEIAALKAGHMQ